MPAPQTHRSNEEWLAALRDPEGAEGLAAQAELRSLVQGALRKALGSKTDDATLDDLIQVAMLQVLQKLDRFEGRSRFTTWVYSVAVRAAFTELRRTQYRESAIDESAAAEVADAAVRAEQKTERDEIVDVLNRVIEEELTERQRIAVRGELAGTPQDQLIAELGTNRNALYKLLYDARQRLHAALCKAGICDDEVREAFDL